MEKFEKVSGIAAPMPLVNIDTDMIIPKVFLKTIKRSGLGVNLFDEMRYERDGSEKPDFVLNQPQYRDASILVAGDNFGCGSSRDTAAKGPWLLGVKAVLAQSFERIHRSNLVFMGVLPLQFNDGDSAQSLGLDGSETFDIQGVGDLSVGQVVDVVATKGSGEKVTFKAKARLDTEFDVQYYNNGGILQTVLLKMTG